ncbi:hypothetical protein ABW19_dt0207396 [Dactylella cylindrospora]|nr:hypothetical protein ABW19_dt0207396 [Dactylella cylindrospora]
MTSLQAFGEIALPAPCDDYYLSTLTPADFPRLVDLFSNTDLSHILFAPPYPYTIEDGQWFHDHIAIKPLPDFPGTREAWVIRSKSENGLLIGICGAHPPQSEVQPSPPILHHPEDGENKVFTVGYFLAPEYRGKGIMPFAVREMMKIFPGVTFEAEAEEGNVNSQKVLQRCGFKKVDGWARALEWPESKGGGVRTMWKFVREA